MLSLSICSCFTHLTAQKIVCLNHVFRLSGKYNDKKQDRAYHDHVSIRKPDRIAMVIFAVFFAN